MEQRGVEPPSAGSMTKRGRGAKRVIAAMRRFDNLLHYVAGLSLLGVLSLTIVDIVGRSFFNNPVPGTVEVTAAVLVVIVYLGLAHSEDMGDHITVDLLYVRASPRAQRWMNLVTRALSLVVLLLVAWQLVGFARRQAGGGFTTAVLKWPTWPFVVVAAFGSLLYAIAVLNKIILTALGEPADVYEDAMPVEAADLAGGEGDS